MEFFEFDLERDQELMDSLVACYRDVFSGEPWNEWRKCSACGRHWGIDQHAVLEALGFQHCNEPVKEYWPADVVKTDLRSEISRPGASCWVAVEDETVVGFCHGYPMNASEFNSHLMLDGVEEAFSANYGDAEVVVYLDDIGVKQSHRAKKLGRQLLVHWLSSVERMEVDLSILRTQTFPETIAFLWYSAIGYTVFREYDDERKRVVMAASVESLLEWAA